MKEKIVKINKTKSWFFEKINKIDKPFSQTHQDKKREESNQQNQNEKGEVTTGSEEIQRVMRLL